MIYLYDSPEKIETLPAGSNAGQYCRFEGMDLKIPEFLRDNPQALALVHLIMEGHLAAESHEKATYWREVTETIVEWMIKKGIVETVS